MVLGLVGTKVPQLKNRRPEAPHRCRQSIRAAGAVGRQPAVWFFIGRSREPDQRGRPKEKTRDRRRDRSTNLGLILALLGIADV